MRRSNSARRISEIKNPDGSVVFRLDDIDVPAQFSPGRRRHPGPEIFPQGRRAGAPEEGRGERRPLLAVALGRRRGRARRSCPRTSATAPRPTRARSSTGLPAPGPIGAGRAAISHPRKTRCAFRDELAYMLATQRVAPNSPQWFNTGLHWAYGIDGPGQGHFYVDPFTGKLTKSKSAYEHPQPHACFIQSRRRRPRQRGRHHGPVGARGAPVQIRLRHRLQLLAICAAKAKSSPAAARRPA